MDGHFTGYASLFGVPDLGRDVVLPGAFAASLARRGAAGVRMLWQHDPAEPVGRWLSLREDARGLKVEGLLNLGVGRARELDALMREGGLDGLSIGFRTLRAAPDRAGQRRLIALDLWEVSLVTFPLQPGARIATATASLPDEIRALARRLAPRGTSLSTRRDAAPARTLRLS
jgi:HK97 family phage prohead protease